MKVKRHILTDNVKATGRNKNFISYLQQSCDYLTSNRILRSNNNPTFYKLFSPNQIIPPGQLKEGDYLRESDY